MNLKKTELFVLLALLLFSRTTYAKKYLFLYANDVHGYIEPYNRGGFARLCTLAKRYRKEASKEGFSVFFFVSGDIFQGTLLSRFSKGEAEFKALKACGVDAIVVGNHDFDYGLKRLVQLTTSAGFHVLSANIVLRRTGKKPFEPGYKTSDGLFVTGLTTPKTPYITAGYRDMKKLKFLNPLKVLSAVARNHKGPLVLLSHLGYPQDMLIAQTFKRPLIILGGHTHTLLKHCKRVKGSFVCQAGAYAKFLGVLKLDLEGKRWKVLEDKVVSVTPDTPPDEKVMAAIKGWREKTARIADTKIGRSDKEFAANPSALHMMEVPIGDLVCDAMLQSSGADAGFINAGGIRAGIPKGVITLGQIFRILPFDNHMVILKMKGKDLKKLLRYAARRRGRSGFLQICGMRVRVGPYERIRDVRIQNKRLVPSKTYKVVTIDFLARGGDGYVFLKRFRNTRTNLLLRDAFIGYVKRHSPLTWPPQQRWQFDTGL